MNRRFALIALAALGLIGTATAVRADDPVNEAIWKKYWMAIEAEKSCKNTAFSQGQYDAMVHVINQRINFDLGAGVRRGLMGDAKTQVQDMTFKYGCSDPRVQELLALYETDLFPVTGVH
jgi:hypothetical protein